MNRTRPSSSGRFYGRFWPVTVVCAALALSGWSVLPAVAAPPARLIPPVGHLSDIQDVAVSADGRLLATSAIDGTARVWEAATGREVRAIAVGDRNVYGVAVSPEGDIIYTCAPSGLAAWAIADGRQMWSNKEASGYDIALSPDGKHIAVSKGNFICDAQTGAILHALTHPEATSAVAFSSDGQRVLFGCENGTATMWSLSGRLEGTFSGHTKTVQAVTFSPDGARIATGSQDGTLRVWDVASRRELRQMRVESKGDSANWVTNVQWSPSGTTIAASHFIWGKNGVYLWNPDTGAQTGYQKIKEQLRVRELCFLPDGSGFFAGLETGITTLYATTPLAPVRSFVGQSQQMQSLAVSTDGRFLFAGLYPDMRASDPKEVGAIQVDLQSGRMVRRYGNLFWGAQSLSVSADGSRLVTAGDDKSLALFDTHTGKRLVSVASYYDSGHGVLSPDGKMLAFEDRGDEKQSGSGNVSLFSAASGKKIRTLTHPNPRDTDSSVALGFSADCQTVVLATGKQRLRAWNVQNGALIRDTQIVEPGYEKFDNGNYDIGGAVQPGTTRVAMGRNQPAIHDAVTGQTVRRFSGSDITCFAFSQDGKRLAGGGRTNMYVWDTQTGATIQTWKVGSVTRAVALSANGDRVFYAENDTVLRVADVNTGQAVLSYLALTDGDWLALSPSGSFDGSPGGINRVSFENNGKTFDVSQFAETFYQAGLVPSALGARTDDGILPPPTPAPIAQVIASPPPLVRLVVPASATAPTIEVTVEATEQAKGGVKAVRLYHNGRLVGGPSVLRGIGIEAVSGATTTKKFTVALEAGANEFRAVAYSNTDVESVPALTTVSFTRNTVTKPVLHVLSIGVNVYKDATMNLAYARPDADALADFFDAGKSGRTGGGGSLFSSVEIARLMDTDATGAAILARLDGLASTTKSGDVVLIYLAGHGETAKDTWYFLPSEMRQMALTERVQEFGIPWHKIEAAVGRIPARKIVLVVDACKSGAIVNGVRGGVGEQQAMAVMARAQGIHILTASNGQQYAGEVKALGHGILTYALLEGLSGKAGQAGDATIMVSELMSYVDRRVPELSLKYRGEEQFPTPLARGQNFPVAPRQ